MDNISHIKPEDHVALVHHIVNQVYKTFPSYVDRDDVLQAGMLGLVEAANRFDANNEQGVPFANWAGRRIQGAIMDFVRSYSWTPRHVRAKIRAYNRAEELVMNSTGDADVALIALEMETTVDEVLAIKLHIGKSITSSALAQPKNKALKVLDAPVPLTPEEAYSAAESSKLLHAALEELSEKQRYVLARYFGDEVGLAEIAEELGVGVSRISKLKHSALERLEDLLAYQSKVHLDPPESRRERALYDAAVKVAQRAAS